MMRPGDLIDDRFELDKQIGSGGSSLVYRALDYTTGGWVAVKALRPLEPGDRERFAREATLLAELRHPAVVEYVAHGLTDSGRPYIVMEWIEGESLERRLGRGPLSIAEVIALGRRIAEALGAAHRQGVIHRDIKPGNIMLRDGQIEAPKLLDFGVARANSELGLTLTGALVGTPGYMSPEQARGEKDLDARADVFALGCLLFRCVTGRPVFGGNDVLAAIMKVTVEDAPRLSSIVPETPPKLDALVARMLSRPIEARPRDGAETAAALAAIDPAAPSPARPPPPPASSERELGAELGTLMGRPSPCVGREREIEALLAAFDACAAGPSARAVLVTAGAGAGKSRLRQELIARLRARGSEVEVLLGGGDAMSTGAPFGVIASALRRAAGLIADETLAVRRRKLAARVGRHLSLRDRVRVTEFLGELVFSPTPGESSDRLRAARQNPSLRGDQMRLAWEDFLAAECRHKPVLIVLEDLQWGDLPSVQFIDAALRNLADRRLMVLALARPEVRSIFRDLWADRAVTPMELGNLSPEASAQIARHALGEGAPREVVARVVEQSAGNAFHLEELIRAVAEGRGDALLPESMVTMLKARLRELSPAGQKVLRAASVFGQEATEGGIKALVLGALSAVEIKGALADLVRREVLAPAGQARAGGDPEYAFPNALVCEAAYAMFTDEDRATAHRLAASFLEQEGDAEALGIAEHFERARERRRAASWYLRAAEQALAGCDDAAALNCGERGIACGAEGEELGRIALVLSQAHQSRGQNVEAEARAYEAMRWLPLGSERWYTAIAEAAAACAGQGHLDKLIELAAVLRDAVLAGDRSGPLWIAAASTVGRLYQIGREDLGGSLLDLLQAATYAGAERDPEVRGRLHSALAKRARHEGDPAGYLAERQAAAAALEEAGDMRGASMEQVNTGFALLELGAYAEAERSLRASLAAADRLALGAVRAAAFQNLGFSLMHLGALDEACRLERQAVAQFAAAGNRRMEGGSRIYLAAILSRRGELEDAEREAVAAASMLTAAPPLRPYALAVHAQVLLGLGQPREALAATRTAVDLVAELGDNNAESEVSVLLTHAEALFATGDHAGAREAIARARGRLLDQAAKIRDERLRQSFLEHVPEHRRTLALAGAWLEGR